MGVDSVARGVIDRIALRRRDGAAQADRPVSEARTPEYYRKRPCAELVAFAAGLLEEKLKERLRAESGVGQ